MEISIRQRGIQVNEELREQIERRVGFALQSFESRIRSVEVLVEELALRGESKAEKAVKDKDAGLYKENGSVKPVAKEVDSDVPDAVNAEMVDDAAELEAERIDPERKNVRAERLRSGASKYCQIMVYPRRGEVLKVEEYDASVLAAIGRVADRLNHVVSRRFERNVSERHGEASRRRGLERIVDELPDPAPGLPTKS